MVKAIASFTVRGADGRPKTFDVGDDVPQEIADQVGDHVVDRKSGGPATPTQSGDGVASEAVEALEGKVTELTEKLGAVEEERDKLRALLEGVVSGDLTDVDLETLEGTKAFDPDVKTVDEVLDHLEGVDENERARVIAAEKAGRNRKGIVGDE